MTKPKLYVLVGVPASGKSTWIQEQSWAYGCAYISTDQYVDEYAHEQGKTYSEVFDEYMSIAVSKMANAVIVARSEGKDIIWDQTSTTIASRRRKFDMLPDYHAIAVVFRTPPEKEWKRRLESRPGKVIPAEVLESMVKGWEEPTEEEGFAEIWYAA
jgi:predicted kinase